LPQSARLVIPYYPQEKDYSCVPACARMMLEHYGVRMQEKELRRILETKPLLETPAANVARLATKLAVRAQRPLRLTIGPCDLADLTVSLAGNCVPIVFLQTGPLPSWSYDCGHAVVVVRIDDPDVAVHDPHPYQGPNQSIPRSSFEKAWATTGNLAALFEPA